MMNVVRRLGERVRRRRRYRDLKESVGIREETGVGLEPAAMNDRPSRQQP